ncbi:T9SS type A sorting domain-containing protein [uncultured Muribaculum sp.]|uniref:T9SS type A sorting domain-containing protein n=2 Tax=uncultured Muribaculum sp. TaxID=1918613 RepID=UPI00272C1549|nr:T9SS type A sorting domain-containing protein [uncultured Muribaculum sp.]
MPWGKSVSVPQPDLNFHSKSATHSGNPTRQRKKEWRALQIPEDKLKSLTTADLLTVCLDFPYAMDMLAYDYPEVGFNAVCKEFNGYRELLTRKDLTDALLKKCEAIPAGIASILNKDEVTQGDYSFKCYILFHMMGIDKVTSSLDAEKSAKFAASIREAATKMKAYPDIFGISYRTGVKKSGISLLSNPVYNDATRTIPNGYLVYIKELVSGDFSSSEKKNYKNWAINVYKVEFVEDATYTYNCHFYGWYMQSIHNSERLWLNNPSIYWESGLYYEVPEKEGEVVLYYDSSDFWYYKCWHSARRINSNQYVSKWGAGCLVKHTPTNVPEEYGKSRKYYKRYRPTIDGPVLTSSSGTYSIDLLPPGYSVTWSLSDSYYAQNCMTVDANGSCTITRATNRDMDNATLTATLHYNGHVATTVTKTIHAYSGFKATYDWTDPNNKQSLDYPYIIYRQSTHKGQGLNIYSLNLINATVAYDGDMVPTRWVYDDYNGYINVRFDSDTRAQAFVITVNCEAGEYRIIVLNQARSYSLSAGMDGDNLNVSIGNENSDALAQKFSTVGIQASAEELEWTLEVYDTVNSRMVYSGKVMSTETSINTSGWTPGIYVVRATLGDNTLSKKILIK